MKKTKNFYDFKPERKNQLIAIVCHLEMMGINTRSIDVDEWSFLTVRLSVISDMNGDKMEIIEASVSSVFKGESSYEALNLDVDNLEECEFFKRFMHIVSMVDKAICQ